MDSDHRNRIIIQNMDNRQTEETRIFASVLNNYLLKHAY